MNGVRCKCKVVSVAKTPRPLTLLVCSPAQPALLLFVEQRLWQLLLSNRGARGDFLLLLPRSFTRSQLHRPSRKRSGSLGGQTVAAAAVRESPIDLSPFQFTAGQPGRWCRRRRDSRRPLTSTLMWLPSQIGKLLPVRESLARSVPAVASIPCHTRESVGAPYRH